MKENVYFDELASSLDSKLFEHIKLLDLVWVLNQST